MDATEMTADSGLRLLVDGRDIPPRDVVETIYLFDLPAGVGDVFIVSRSVIPAHPRPACHAPEGDDIRRLGVSVMALILRDPRLEVRLPAHDPSLTDGFHEPEPGHRWTNGKARLPWRLLAMFPDAFRLELRLCATSLRYPLM